MVKNLPANAGDMRCRFDPWVGKISWRRAWQSTLVFLPGKSRRVAKSWTWLKRLSSSRMRVRETERELYSDYPLVSEFLKARNQIWLSLSLSTQHRPTHGGCFIKNSYMNCQQFLSSSLKSSRFLSPQVLFCNCKGFCCFPYTFSKMSRTLMKKKGETTALEKSF